MIDPQSISLSVDMEFEFNPTTQKITLLEEIHGGLTVCYKVLPINIMKKYALKSTKLYDSTAFFRIMRPVSNKVQTKDAIIDLPGLYANGSLTRGVSFGNSQSLNVISSFNFQMDGQIADNLFIRADITDQNVPYQPEGNTQQLREFDNVIIEVYNDNLSMTAGDVLLQNGHSNFLRYRKNVLGGRISTDYSLGELGSGKSELAVSAAKGQFADITIKAEEGMQGPYQLHGPNGQNFVIILANSEQVYLDGQLMKRGYNHDYTIDYNLGELTFNPNVLITQFSRLRVTFEYADQNYSRSILTAGQAFHLGSTRINVGFYRERDDIQRPLAFQLSEEDKIQMSLANDRSIPVAISSVRPQNFSAERTLYQRKDTLDQNGELQVIYVYSRDSTASLYQITFTKVGTGQGDYVLVNNDVNGRVYEWISPIDGVSQGDYAPLKLVPAPNQRQMLVIGGRVDLTKNLMFFSELATSNHDLNLYAVLDNADNTGWAQKSGLELDELPLDFLPGSVLSAHLSYEHDSRDFRPIDRYRSIEFDRDWSYNPASDTFRTADNILQSGFSIRKDQRNLFSAQYGVRDKNQVIDGYQQEVEMEKDLGPLHLSSSYFDMENQSNFERSKWTRWHSDVSITPFVLVPGYRISVDQNVVLASSVDSLVQTAMNYEAHQFYLKSGDSSKVSFRMDHTIREDRNILEGQLQPFSKSNTTTANFSSAQTGDHYLNLTMTLREVDYSEYFEEREDENMILGRVLARNSFIDRSISTDLNYATSSSREIFREFIYVQVPTGEGTHAWRDLNEDGIQDLTEFFEAINFDERNYIRLFVPTTEFIEAFNTVFTFSVNAKFPKTWQTNTWLGKAVSKLSSRTNVNINKKNTGNDFSDRFNPFSLELDDQDLIYSRDGIRSTLFYNRTGRGVGLDFTYASNRSKQQILNGIDSRELNEWTLNGRYHLSGEVSVTAKVSQSTRFNASQYNENRNFIIDQVEIAPGLTWQPSQNLRMAVLYMNKQKVNNSAEVKESAMINRVVIESRWSRGISNSLNANLSMAKIQFDGDVQTAAAYEMLEALNPGFNYSWLVNYSQKLHSGLQLNLVYEGRKSEEQRMIHMGRMQITALF